ncbi:uncharacterized protein LOC135225360 [Macrobrachium nipponense]|uniref:uncharacterized protein LOC135225360 n=1 Tax=Macrobrachium nipponense TaxID=159736 RepID=UPI0030C8049C
MCDRLKEFVALGQELGYEGGELREFVKGQQAAERDERHERAEARKLELEAEERKNLRQHELQKIKLSSPSSLGLEGTSIVETDRFGWTTVLKLVPKFNESEVSKYFQSFEKLMKNSLAVSESGIRKLVTVLRDTGAAISVVLKSSLPDDPVAGDEFVLIGGFPDACIACPLQTIYLDTDYVTGLVKVAVADTLPVKGVDILLGNDLGKESCLVNPIVMKTPTPEAEVAVVTRSGFVTDSDNYDLDLGSNVDSSLISAPLETSLQRDDLIRAQRDDVSLKHIFEKCEEGSGNDVYVKEKFILKNNLLHRLSRPIYANSNEVIDQVVIPFKLRPKISLAHDNIMSGHLGVNKTFKKMYDSFYWPSLRRDVKNFVNSCHECPMAGKLNKPIPKAPLINNPVTGEPFEHIVIDIVGPLPRSKRGNCYIFSIIDRMSRFPEAIPIRNAKAKAVVQHLIACFTRFGLPKTLQSDNGSNFTGKFFKDQMRNFGIKHITSTPYHPESQGVIERFHQTLKHILRKLCSGEDNLWDVMLPYALFALRQAPSETLGLSPFDLVFGHKVRSPVEVLRETWDDEKEVNVADKIDNFKTKLFRAWDLARENQASAHQKNKIVYDRKAKSRVFEKGDLVLALFPKEGSSLKYKFSGPYKVLDKKGDVNYLLQCDGEFEWCNPEPAGKKPWTTTAEEERNGSPRYWWTCWIVFDGPVGWSYLTLLGCSGTVYGKYDFREVLEFRSLENAGQHTGLLNVVH